MPGLDGTGPRGRGPMTGRCRGFCALKVPPKPEEPISGFAGQAGRPFTLPPIRKATLAQLHGQAARMEDVLRAIRGRIERLEAEVARST